MLCTVVGVKEELTETGKGDKWWLAEDKTDDLNVQQGDSESPWVEVLQWKCRFLSRCL